MVSPGGHPQNSAKFQPRYTEGMKIQAIPSTLLGENAYVVHSEGASDALVIDPGYGTADPIHDYLARHQLEVANVLLTHGHPDHVWDCAEFDVPVWIPAPDVARLDNPLAWLPPVFDFGSEWHKPRDIRTLPVDTVELIEGIPMLSVPAPGHTAGSSFILFTIPAGEALEGNLTFPTAVDADRDVALAQPIALSGDVVFAGSVGRTDFPGGDETQMRHTLRTLANAIDPATWLLPGHGAPTVWGDEQRSNPYVIRAKQLG